MSLIITAESDLIPPTMSPISIIVCQNMSTSKDNCPDLVNRGSAGGFHLGLLRALRDVIKVHKIKNRYYKISSQNKRRGGKQGMC